MPRTLDHAAERRAARRAAERHGVDPDIFERQIGAESGFNRNARSPAGAQDIAQFIPSTAKAYGVTLGDGKIDDDLDGAARYMRDNLDRTGGDYEQALSIYNSGKPDGFKRFDETRNYVLKIMRGEKPAPPSAGDTDRPSAEAAPTEEFDGDGYEAARKRAVLGAFITKRNPNSLLLRTGVVSPEEPDRGDFTQLAAARSAEHVEEKAPDSGGKAGEGVTELFYDPLGGWKNGEKIGAIGGHGDHVHFAGKTRAETLALARLAEKMGLDVRELAEYDKVDPVHTKGSYHYRPSGAGDASGTPEEMRAFALAALRREKLER